MCVFIKLKRRCEKEKRPLLEAHCCSVKTVWHHSTVAPEKKKEAEMSLSLPTFLAFCGHNCFFFFSSLPSPFSPSFSTVFFLRAPSISVFFFHTLSWPSGYDPAAYTNRGRYTGENDKNVQREIWIEMGKKAEAWETARRQDHKSVFCLKRNSEKTATRYGELTQHHHRSAKAANDSSMLPSLFPLVSYVCKSKAPLLMTLGSKGLQNQAECVCCFFFPTLSLALGFWKKCCEMKEKTEQT